ncbi:MAG: peptide ABC transporter permease [Elusimicrobia bacterium]|nr:MAG: peptide ABC transporter permease [Elusimicrobiota bacterium]
MTTATLEKPVKKEPRFGESLFTKSVRKFRRDRLGMASLSIVGVYAVIALCVKLGLFCSLDLTTTPVGPQHIAPGQTYQHILADGKTEERVSWFGTDIRGNSVGRKLIYSIKQAFAIGIMVAFFSVLIGVVLGSISGYFGGRVDDFLLWVYTSMSSVPYILWIIAISYAFGKGFLGVIVALSSTFWVGVYFNIRAEVRRLKEMEYVLASESFGMTRMRIIFGDILPNMTHLISIFLSLNFIAAIKNEVILAFLGLGIAGEPSWGGMISSARLDLIAGKWWEVTGATILLFILVMAFNLFTDSLQDAFDPKKVG